MIELCSGAHHCQSKDGVGPNIKEKAVKEEDDELGLGEKGPVEHLTAALPLYSLHLLSCVRRSEDEAQTYP